MKRKCILGFGFTQSIVDRRLFYLHDKSGLLLMVGTFVGDCRLVVQSETIAAAFNEAWERKYRGPPDADATARDFLGSSTSERRTEGRGR